MKSTITFVAFAGYVAAQQGYGPPAYVPPSYDTTTSTTAPAQYPTTTSSQSVPQYPTTTSSKAAYPSCPAPGVTENGCYSCNPAHQYPEGQTCEYKDGCPCLVYHSTSQPPSYPTTTSSEPPKYPTTTSTSVEKPYPSCPAPGVTEHGCYSCNPAHQYPEGQTCEYKDGCPCLVTKTSSIPSYPTSSSSSQPPKYPTTTSTTVAKPYPSCPAPGTTEHGCYSCNPAHQYPEGQTCEYKDGCPCLVTKSSTIPSYPTTTKTSEKPKPTCPAPGKTENGCYSCNPAHQYPEGQSCEDVKGCPCLVTKTSTKPSYPTAPVYTTKVVTELTTYCPQPTTFTHQQTTYTITSATTLTLPCKGGCTVTQTKSYPAPSATPSCPAPGKTENGCYSCNPAHQYPAGNKCELVKGCYCLYTPPAPTTKVYVNTTQPPVYTTKVVTDYTTYCPSPTTFTHEQKTYTVTKPTTVTLPCEHGCTVTTKITPPPTTVTKVYTPPVETHPVAPPPSKPVETHPVATPSKPVETHPVAPPPVYTPPVETHPVATPSKPVETHPVAPPPYPTKETHTAPAPSQPSATRPVASTTQPVQYTGAAAPMKTGVPMLAAVAMGALFL